MITSLLFNLAVKIDDSFANNKYVVRALLSSSCNKDNYCVSVYVMIEFFCLLPGKAAIALSVSGHSNS